MKKILSLALIVMFVITGCQSQASMKKKPMQTFINSKAGYVILVPQEWQKKREDDVSTGFVGQNPNIAMDIVFEIGGFDYFSLDSLGDVVIKHLKGKLKNLKVVDKGASKVNNDAYRIIVQGKNSEGKEIIVKAIFFESAIGIRYYLMFAANPKDFYDNDYLFEDISQTFQMTKTDLDLYKLLTNREEEQYKQQHAKEMKTDKAKRDKYQKELLQQKQKTKQSN